MKDIDFDELDKAVNSLMSSSDAPTNEPKVQTPVVITGASKRRTAAVSRSPMIKGSVGGVANTPSKTTVVPSKPAPAVKRTGRFMDVVDSSSELNPLKRPVVAPTREAVRKPTQPSAPAVAPKSDPAQSAPSPVGSSISETIAVSVKPKPTPTPVITPIVEPSPVIEKIETPAEPTSSESNTVLVRRVEKSSDMPDPLDVLSNPVTPTEDAGSDVRPVAAFGAPDVETIASAEIITVEAPDASIEKELEAPLDLQNKLNEAITQLDMPTDTVTTAPQAEELLKEVDVAAPVVVNESPFVVDAKIEKRPLNANAPTMDTSQPLSSLDELMKQNQPETPALIETESPFEKSDEPPIDPEVPELSSELVAIEATGKVAEDAELIDTVPTSVQAATAAADPVPAGPASIVQQYQAGESSGDASHTPIYDTTNYTDPIVHPKKKASGWMWVLGVLVLLAIGSGGAVALYFMGIIP